MAAQGTTFRRLPWARDDARGGLDAEVEVIGRICVRTAFRRVAVPQGVGGHRGIDIDSAIDDVSVPLADPSCHVPSGPSHPTWSYGRKTDHVWLDQST
jgi:hypothetical protein